MFDCLNLLVHIVTAELKKTNHSRQLLDDLSEVLCRTVDCQIFCVFH